jgi:hypothetical protein
MVKSKQLSLMQSIPRFVMLDTKEKVQRPRMCCSVFNMRKSPFGSANMVAKKEERKKEKEKREKMTGH